MDLNGFRMQIQVCARIQADGMIFYGNFIVCVCVCNENQLCGIAFAMSISDSLTRAQNARFVVQTKNRR